MTITKPISITEMEWREKIARKNSRKDAIKHSMLSEDWKYIYDDGMNLVFEKMINKYKEQIRVNY